MQHDYDLQRFVTAQADSYEAALAEIKQGAKRSHWMWYIFPQLAGLGTSPIARHYAIGSIDEAKAYLGHPLLGSRLLACIKALQALPPTTAEKVFGGIDSKKLRSSITLFMAAGGEPIFEEALQRWFAGQADDATLKLLST